MSYSKLCILLNLIFLTLENQSFTQLDENILGLENLSLRQELSYFKFLLGQNYSFLRTLL